jgi:hypothetical protein
MRKAAVAGLAVLVFAAIATDVVPLSPASRKVTHAANPYWTNGYGPPAQRVEFGRIVKLRREGKHWVLRLDPAFIVSGRTANVAAADDGVIARGEVMPNDNYVRDEAHKLLSYVVANDANVRVLTRSAGRNGQSTISVAQLAAILAGTSRIRLFEPLSTGVWIQYHVDTVSRIQQEYHP